MTRADILVVADLRFTGGTSAALAADIAAFSALGLRVDLMGIESSFLDADAGTVVPVVAALLDLPGVAMAPASPAAEIVFLHHPMTFAGTMRGARPIVADRAVLVAHHPPFRGDGSLEYNPVSIALRVRRGLGLRPLWAPVSGLIRTQLRAFSPLIALTGEDWHNVFDPAAWRATRQVFDSGKPVVGRHGRPDRLKWPDTVEAVAGPLDPGPGWRTRIMGCPPEALSLAGSRTEAWEILPFGAMSSRDFLEGIDAFVYYHHPAWVEAFGRTVAEAILMERPCLLDPKLAATFGDLAEYGPPSEAPARLAAWRADPALTRIRAADRRDRALARYGDASVAARLGALRHDSGTRSRAGPKVTSPAVTARKTLGLARRRIAEGWTWGG